jgi:uncharacterized membrane protein YjfL (UPF0719 family)
MTYWLIGIYAVNIVIAVGALFAFRYLAGILAGVNVKDELAHKDNFAFGLSMAGGLTALCLVMSAAVTGEAAVSLLAEATHVMTYAVSGLVLLKLGMLINEKIILRGFSIKQKIAENNLAVGTTSAVNLMAQGLIIAAAIKWVEVDDWTGIGAVALVWLASQLVLLAVTRLRMAIYKKRHQGGCWQDAIAAGNCALAIRYAGQIIATALAVTAVSNIVLYAPSLILYSVAAWLAYSLAMVVVIWLLYRLVLPAILPGVDIVSEVDDQQNIGVAFIEASVFIGLAVILKSLLV